MIALIDYGMGNLSSIIKAFRRVEEEVIVTREAPRMRAADKIILPGVGNFKRGLSNLKDLNLIDELCESVTVQKKPVLGICLGMQLFSHFSEEGNVEGLGLVDASTLKFRAEAGIKIPHVGWNTLSALKGTYLLKEINEDDQFYFVHSYHMVADNLNNASSMTFYGYDFISSIEKDNVFGVQFHPEKSFGSGLKILKNFSRM